MRPVPICGCLDGFVSSITATTSGESSDFSSSDEEPSVKLITVFCNIWGIMIFAIVGLTFTIYAIGQRHK